MFVPITWADPTQQPLAVKPAYRPVYVFQGNPKKTFTADALASLVGDIQAHRAGWPDLGNIYLLVVGLPPEKWPALPDFVSTAAHGNNFVLLKFAR